MRTRPRSFDLTALFLAALTSCRGEMQNTSTAQAQDPKLGQANEQVVTLAAQGSFGSCAAFGDKGSFELREQRDPWGTAFKVDCAHGYEAQSAGPDRQWGTKDDITKKHVDPPRWGFGVQSPLEVVTHLHHASGEPAYCDPPATLVARLEAAIKDDANDAGPSACSVVHFADPDNVPVLRISCVLRVGDDGCKDYYMGQLWTERFERSTTDYALRGYGWVRRSCTTSSKSYSADDIRDVANKTSGLLEKVVGPCRSP